jgi:peptidoglycan/LPS O-acetylase OafA/YrhL
MRAGPGEASPRGAGAQENYLPTLDGWRAVAIALVLLDHAGDRILAQLARLGLPIGSLSRATLTGTKEAVGLFGVHIFFSLSGYLITSRLIQEASRRPVSLKAFYLRRVFRIQPAALTYLLVIGALSLAGVLAVSLGAWRSALLCYANLYSGEMAWYTAHFWSLSIEEHFYLVWPLIFVLLGERRRLGGALALVFALSVWQAVSIKFQIAMTSAWIVRTDMQAEYLMCGCALAIARSSSRWKPTMARLTGSAPLSLGLVLMTAAALIPVSDWKVAQVLRSTGAAATAIVLAATSTQTQTWFARLLELRPLVWLGRRSYSLYLWQQLFIAWDDKRAPALGLLQSFPMNLTCALVAASASYYLIEQPAIRLGRRTIRRLRASGDPVRAADSVSEAVPAIES